MRLKKGIVLFVTIIFILAISVLIVKNLEVTDKFITLSSKNTNIKQLELSIKDINSAIIKLLVDHKSNLPNPLDITLPSTLYGNVNIEQIKLNEIDKLYILDNNLTNNTDGTFNQYIEKRVLVDIIRDKNISNQRQVDFVIDEYISQTQNTDILEIAEQLTYPKLNTPISGKIILCKYSIDIDGLRADVSSIIKIDNNNVSLLRQPTINIKR